MTGQLFPNLATLPTGLQFEFVDHAPVVVTGEGDAFSREYFAKIRSVGANRAQLQIGQQALCRLYATRPIRSDNSACSAFHPARDI